VQIAAMEAEREDLKQRIATAESSSVTIAPEERERRRKEYDKFRAEWVKRKRQCGDVVAALADGMDKKPKAVEEDLGIQTDASVGIASIPPANLLGGGAAKVPAVRFMHKKKQRK